MSNPSVEVYLVVEATFALPLCLRTDQVRSTARIVGYGETGASGKVTLATD